jgi:CubicO group peptidase (beta-lactamase class C family)
MRTMSALQLVQTMLCGVVLLATATLAARAAEPPLAGIESVIERARADSKNVGAAVAIVRGSKVIYARGFGVRQLGNPARVDVDTLFEIGSTTKAFTTAALGMLVDEGKIGWDDPIIDHVPGFRLQDPWLTQHLTIRDAITHRTGIEESLYPFLSVMSSDEAIQQLRYADADAAFRDSYRYNNLMYAVAGKVIEAASGMSWGEFIKRRVLQPLEMSRSGTSAYDFWEPRYVAPTYFGSAAGGQPNLTDARDSNVALPHGLDRNGGVIVFPWQSFDSAAPAGAIVSSAADMAHWLILQLNEGRFEGRELLRKETLRALHTSQNLHGGRLAAGVTPEGYAMGWRRGRYLDQVFLEHGGHMLGFPAYVALLPERQIGIVVLANGPEIPNENPYTLHQSIALWTFARLLGASPAHAPRPTRSGAAEKPETRLQLQRQDAAPSLPLSQYAGAYEDRKAHSGPVDVRVEGGQLQLKFAGQGAFSAQLTPWRGDLFRLQSNAGIPDVLGPAFVRFVVNPCGSVVAMSIDSQGFKARLDKVEPAGSEAVSCGGP